MHIWSQSDSAYVNLINFTAIDSRRSPCSTRLLTQLHATMDASNNGPASEPSQDQVCYMVWFRSSVAPHIAQVTLQAFWHPTTPISPFLVASLWPSRHTTPAATQDAAEDTRSDGKTTNSTKKKNACNLLSSHLHVLRLSFQT